MYCRNSSVDMTYHASATDPDNSSVLTFKTKLSIACFIGMPVVQYALHLEVLTPRIVLLLFVIGGFWLVSHKNNMRSQSERCHQSWSQACTILLRGDYAHHAHDEERAIESVKGLHPAVSNTLIPQERPLAAYVHLPLKVRIPPGRSRYSC